MKIEQYKNDVSSLKLSDSFKQSLKESMAKEYEAVAVTETPVKPWMKYSKYIATAACLALIIATVSVVSLMGDGLKVEKNDASQESVYDDNAMAKDANDSATLAETEGTWAEDEIDDGIDEEIDDTPITAEEEPAPAEETEVETEEDIEEAVEPGEPETAEAAPLSAYTPEEYDGEYVTTDYVIGNNTSPEYSALNLCDTIELLAAYTSSSAYDDEELDEAAPVTPSDEEEEDAVVVDVAEEDAVEEEAAPSEAVNKYEDSGISYSELSLNTLRHMDSVNFVRFSITNVYSADEAYSITGDEDFLNCKTLYEINVNYDYINGSELDVTLKLAAYGTSENQLVGRPIFEDGDRMVACLTFDNDGYAEMLDELVYVIHRINGVDIAYHLVGGSGVNPGDTHMGMLDIEREVITTTLNNPAQYTHKAALKELYRYLRRNWTREEYTITDFSKINLDSDTEQQEEVQEQAPTETPVEKLKKSFAQGKVDITIDGVAFDPKGDGSIINERYRSLSIGTGSSSSRSYINFSGAGIYFDTRTLFEGSMAKITLKTGCVLPIKINGVGIGDTMDALVDAFNIGNYVDGRLTLYIASYNENGIAYTVTFEVEDNVIVNIEIE